MTTATGRRPPVRTDADAASTADGRYPLGAHVWTWRVQGEPARYRTPGYPNDLHHGQGRDGFCAACTHHRGLAQAGGPTAGAAQPSRPAAGCACRNARHACDARDPSGHNNQVRMHGRCWCPCHGSR